MVLLAEELGHRHGLERAIGTGQGGQQGADEQHRVVDLGGQAELLRGVVTAERTDQQGGEEPVGVVDAQPGVVAGWELVRWCGRRPRCRGSSTTRCGPAPELHGGTVGGGVGGGLHDVLEPEVDVRASSAGSPGRSRVATASGRRGALASRVATPASSSERSTSPAPSASQPASSKAT